MQAGETQCLQQWYWDVWRPTTGEEAGLVLLQRKNPKVSFLWVCMSVHCKTLTCFACCCCSSTCGCCAFPSRLSTALFPLTTEYQCLPLCDVQLPLSVTYASHFFSQKNNEFYWLFSLFLPTPSAPSLMSLPAPWEGNENSNKITNSPVAASYLLLSMLCHKSCFWREGWKSKQLLGLYSFLHWNLTGHQFFSCMELLQEGLNAFFSWLH